jgi:hypothetical protein
VPIFVSEGGAFRRNAGEKSVELSRKDKPKFGMNVPVDSEEVSVDMDDLLEQLGWLEQA